MRYGQVWLWVVKPPMPNLHTSEFVIEYYELSVVLFALCIANSKMVHTSLGGANHDGYLDMVLSYPQYPMISAQPFEDPEHPGPLVIPSQTTQQCIVTLTQRHAKQVRLLSEFTGVKKA